MEWTELYFKIKTIAYVAGFVLAILLVILGVILEVILEIRNKKRR